MPQLQQVKIMFTTEAAHKINAACKGSSVTPLDSENQRVFNDVFDHGVNGEFYTVELASGKGFSYPTRNIERVRSADLVEDKSVLDQDDAVIFAILDSLFSNVLNSKPTTKADIVAAGLYNESLELELQAIKQELASELAEIEAEMIAEIEAAQSEYDEDIARLYRQ